MDGLADRRWEDGLADILCIYMPGAKSIYYGNDDDDVEAKQQGLTARRLPKEPVKT